MGKAITKSEISRIYALGAVLHMVEAGNKGDLLHALAYELIGKDSISALTPAEYKVLEGELIRRLQLKNHTEPLKNRKKEEQPAAPGMITPEQQSKIWRLIYQLAEADPRATARGKRLCGAIRTILGVDARPEEPFKWITMEQGSTLINQLKRYVRAAQARQSRQKQQGGEAAR